MLTSIRSTHMSTYDPTDPGGKGDWNRPRDMEKYANNKAAIQFDCPQCHGTRRVKTADGETFCCKCAANVIKQRKTAAGTRTTYRF